RCGGGQLYGDGLTRPTRSGQKVAASGQPWRHRLHQDAEWGSDGGGSQPARTSLAIPRLLDQGDTFHQGGHRHPWPQAQGFGGVVGDFRQYPLTIRQFEADQQLVLVWGYVFNGHRQLILNTQLPDGAKGQTDIPRGDTQPLPARTPLAYGLGQP